MSLSTHLTPAPSLPIPRLAPSFALLRRAVRVVGRLYADRPHPPAPSLWRDGDLPSVPYAALDSLRRYR